MQFTSSPRTAAPLQAHSQLCCCRFRWIKFEEKVEEGGERWSKPHVSTLSLHSLFELRTCLQTGTVLLDLDGYSLPQIIGMSLQVAATRTKGSEDGN